MSKDEQNKDQYPLQLQHLLEMHRSVLELFEDLTSCEDCFNVGENMEEAADNALVLKKSLEIIEDMAKTFRGAIRENETKAVTEWIQNPTDTSIHGKVSTSTPKIKTGNTLPSMKKDPDTYKEFMRSVGVPDDLVERGVFQPRWNEYTEWLADMQAQGKPLPKCIKDVGTPYTMMSLTSRAKIDLFTRKYDEERFA